MSDLPGANHANLPVTSSFLLLRFRQLELTGPMNTIVQMSLGVPCDFPRSMALQLCGCGAFFPAVCGAAAPPLKLCGTEHGFNLACLPLSVKLRYCEQTLRPCGTPKGSYLSTKQASPSVVQIRTEEASGDYRNLNKKSPKIGKNLN